MTEARLIRNNSVIGTVIIDDIGEIKRIDFFPGFVFSDVLPFNGMCLSCNSLNKGFVDFYLEDIEEDESQE